MSKDSFEIDWVRVLGGSFDIYDPFSYKPNFGGSKNRMRRRRFMKFRDGGLKGVCLKVAR